MSAPASAPAVPLFDLRLSPDDLAAVEVVLRSGRLGAGAEVEAFEEAFARHLGVRHAVVVSTCTAALHLAYRAVGVGPGDEVIVPSTTFAATATAVLYQGATPVFADIVGDHDAGVDPAHVASLVGPRTAAVGAVHFAGYPAAVEELAALCDRAGIALVEDAAHAPLAATASGRPLGGVGRVGAFSFFSNKVLSCGEGGLVATDDPAVAERVRTMRARYEYVLDEPRAALLSSRLRGLADDVAHRRRLVHRYRERLAGVAGLELPYDDAAVDSSSCYVMPVTVTDPQRRDPLREHLRERHVQTSLLYPAVHEFTAYRQRYPALSLPRAERWARTEVTLPLYPHLTDDDQDRVVDAVVEGLS